MGISDDLMEARTCGNKNVLEKIHEMLANRLYLLEPLPVLSVMAK